MRIFFEPQVLEGEELEYLILLMQEGFQRNRKNILVTGDYLQEPAEVIRWIDEVFSPSELLQLAGQLVTEFRRAGTINGTVDVYGRNREELIAVFKCLPLYGLSVSYMCPLRCE